MSQTIERFVKSLCAAFGRSIKPERERYYINKLGKWTLTDDQWARALSAIVSECDDFPQLKHIYPFLLFQSRGSKAPDPIWQMFDLSKLRYARKLRRDAVCPPVLPDYADNQHIVTPSHLEAEEDETWRDVSDIQDPVTAGTFISHAPIERE